MPRMPQRSRIPKKGGDARMSQLPPVEVSNGEAIQFLTALRKSRAATKREIEVVDAILESLSTRIPIPPTLIENQTQSKYVSEKYDLICPLCKEGVDEEVMFYPNGFYCINCGQHIAGSKET